MPLFTPGSVADSAVQFSDITTNDSSTSKHGFLKKLDGTSTHYMDGTGTWSTPAGGSSAMNLVESQTLASDTSFVFTTIPDAATYPWLRILVRCRTADTTDFQARIRFNDDSTSNYAWQQYNGRGSGTSGWLANITASSDTANCNGIMDILVLNVVAGQTFTWQCVGGGRTAADSYSEFCTGYHSTAVGPITKIEINCGSGFSVAFKSGSKASLYSLTG